MVVQRLWQGGGTETHVLSLATALQSKGNVVGIFTSGGAWTHLAKAKGLRVHVRPNQFSSSELQRIVQKHHYLIVHAHDSRSYQLVSDLASHRKLVRAITVHGLYVDALALKRLSPRLDAVIATSPAMERFLITQCGIPQRKLYRIRNGVSTQTFDQKPHASLRSVYHIPKDAFVIGYAGRYTYDKLGMGTRIARILYNDVRNKKHDSAIIAGRNSKLYVTSRSKVIVAGHVARMQQFYNACDVVIGTGRVAIEAMCCGIPTIAVGRSRYIGRVTVENLTHAMDSNFGDHKLTNRYWHTHALLDDIQFVRANRLRAKSDAHHLKHRARRKFSLERMVKRTLHAYHTAKY